MKHRSSRELFAHWNAQRGDQHAPRPDDIRPAAMRAALGDIFILSDRCGLPERCEESHRFRLAGTRICRMFCRELKGTLFYGLWDERDSGRIANLTSIIGAEKSGAVAGLTGQSGSGEAIDLELLMLPLRDIDQNEPRIIGALSPATVPYWLGVRPVLDLRLATVRHLGGSVRSIDPPPLARRIASQRTNVALVVVPGGKR
jgi:hypothetical protein